MDLKEIALLIIFLVVILPGLIGIVISSVKSTIDPSPENMGETTEKVAMQTIPWWVGVMEWFASLPSKIAGLAFIGFVFFLMWLGVFK